MAKEIGQEQAKYIAWLSKEEANGLVDVKFYISEAAKDGLEEEFYREANEIARLVDLGEHVERPDVF